MSNELLVSKNNEADLDYALKVAQIFMKSGKFGKEYNLETVVLMVMYARELGLGIASSCINGFDIIQGKISMKPALMANMIRRAGHSLKILKWEADECVIHGKRADNGDELTISFSMEDARRAGWDQKAVYKQNPKNMLYARAMGNMGRMLFGDIIGNPYAEGEIFEPEKKEPRFMSRPEQTIDATAQAVQEVPKIEHVAKTLDDLMSACEQAGMKTDKSNLLEFILNLRDTKNAKGGKQYSEQDIIQSAFLPGMMEKFCQMLLDYLSQPVDPLAEVEGQ